MEIVLYRTESDRRKVVKNLTGALSVDVKLKAPTEILSPSLLLKGINATSYNYVYIPSFSRYYFIDSFNGISDDLTELQCSVDVLMTYANQIKAINTLVERQEFKRNTEITDDLLVAQANNNFVCQQFGNSVNLDSDYQIYLTVNGG